MCIISAKPAGIPMPSRDTIRTMWDGNRDGAGIMYVENGKVHIEKGFMKYKSFAKKLDELERRLDMTKTPVVMHFRITTHGGTKPENTHPFPITDSVGALRKLNGVYDIGVAHNGIIHITPRAGISDTMEYIASQLAPLKRALPRFYENKHAMQLVKNAIESKMAFLTKEGKIYTVGDFVEDNGVLYSNTSFQKTSMRYRTGSYSYYGGYDWDKFYEDEWEPASPSKSTPPCTPWADDESDPVVDYALMCWLESGDYVVTPDGIMEDGECYLVNEADEVYFYDFEADYAVSLPGFVAYTPAGVFKHFDFDQSECVPFVD